MKTITHTATQHALLRNARALSIPGAYLEDCGKYVRLLVFKADTLDWSQRCNDEAHALKVAKERARGRL